MDRGAWWATVRGVTRVRHDLLFKPPPPIPTYKVFSVDIIWLPFWSNLCFLGCWYELVLIVCWTCLLTEDSVVCCSVTELCPTLGHLMDCMQHTRLPCSSSSPGAWSNSCLLRWWCHTNILPTVVPFSSCLQPFPESGSFLMSQLFTSGGQSIGASTSASVFSMNNSGSISFRIDCFDLLANQGTLSLLQHHHSKQSIFWFSTYFMVQFSQPYVTSGKTIALTVWTFVIKVMSLLFNMLSRLVIAFLPRNNCLLIS